MLRAQLHMHTTESRGTRIKYDSVIRPKDAVDILSKSEVDAVVVTDHNTTRAYKKMRAYAKGRPLIIINGIEIGTTDGHVVGLGVSEGIDHKLKGRKMNAFEACDLIRDFNGEVYIPHPFDAQRKGLGIKIKEVNGIVEIFNPMNIFGFENELAYKVASKLGRPKAVGADAHSPTLLDTCLTCVDSIPEEYSIIKALKGEEVSFENCRYMTLQEMKNWILRRMQFSYLSTMDKITNGWQDDVWYMKLANNWFLRKLEKISLEVGVRNPESKAWDLVSCISYSFAAITSKQTKKHYSLGLERLL